MLGYTDTGSAMTFLELSSQGISKNGNNTNYRSRKWAVSSLNSKNSSGYDSLANKIIKLCRQHISKPLTNIFNKSLSQGIFLEQLKYATVNPLFKKGNKSQFTNYRAISLLTGLSK